jgi:hypothetical protein
MQLALCSPLSVPHLHGQLGLPELHVCCHMSSRPQLCVGSSPCPALPVNCSQTVTNVG